MQKSDLRNKCDHSAADQTHSTIEARIVKLRVQNGVHAIYDLYILKLNTT